MWFEQAGSVQCLRGPLTGLYSEVGGTREMLVFQKYMSALRRCGISLRVIKVKGMAFSTFSVS